MQFNTNLKIIFLYKKDREEKLKDQIFVGKRALHFSEME